MNNPIGSNKISSRIASKEEVKPHLFARISLNQYSKLVMKVDKKVQEIGWRLFIICLINIGDIILLALITMSGYKSGKW